MELEHIEIKLVIQVGEIYSTAFLQEMTGAFVEEWEEFGGGHYMIESKSCNFHVRRMIGQGDRWVIERITK